MAFIALAVGGAAVGGLASLGGAAIQAGATKDAAQMQADAANNATNAQLQMFNTVQQNQKPWLQAGQQALGQMQDPYFQKTFGASDFQQDPGYQFRLQQGLDALQRSAAARGGLQSGGTMRALNDYAQGSASQEYQNAYNRFTNDQTNRFNRLASLAGVGQTANSELNQAGMQTAGNIANIGMSNANAQGAAAIAQGNAWGGALSSIGNGAANNWMTYSMMKKMFPNGGDGTNWSQAPGLSQVNDSYQGPINLDG